MFAFGYPFANTCFGVELSNSMCAEVEHHKIYQEYIVHTQNVHSNVYSISYGTMIFNSETEEVKLKVFELILNAGNI